MLEKDDALVNLMLETIEKIRSFTSDLNTPEEFEKDVESFDATIMNFIVLGEAVSKLSDDVKEKYPGIDWRKIHAFRNVLAHDYFGIYPAEVWEIIQTDLPKLQSDLNSIPGLSL
jgi:uncharacterized protein with HEPN domain